MNINGDIATPFRNRKGTLSQNVMVVCDFDLNFTFISCGWEGSATDARVLRSAIRKGFRVPDGAVTAGKHGSSGRNCGGEDRPAAAWPRAALLRLRRRAGRGA
jgi:hypothetical protein